jgi:alpha-beta hydrolase superfamily lysophospholipase
MNETFSTSLFEHLWIPAASSERGSRHPGKVMIVLHGRGDSLDSFRDIQSELGLEGFDFLVLNAPWRLLGG